MKANELMIGDWVNLKNGKIIMPCRITVIGHATQDRNEIGTTVCVDLSKEFPTCIFDMDVIIPIPITPEILEKNGFTKGGMFGKTYYLAVEDFEISVYFAHVNTQLIIEKRNGKEVINILNVEYLHILQHALNICGIEKTIEL